MLQVDAWVVLRAFIGSLIAGGLFSIVQGFCPLGSIYILFFVYLLGALAGNVLFKFAGRKVGRKVAAVVTVGIFCGSFIVYIGWQQVASTIIGTYAETPVVKTATQPTWKGTEGAAEARLESGSNQASSQANTEQTSDYQSLAAARTALAMERRGNNWGRLGGPSPVSLPLIIFLLGAISPFLGWSMPMPPMFRRW